jgi:hypothetical protein
MEILKLVQGKKVKVSLFMQEEMQGPTGELILPVNKRLPFGFNIPGDVCYFEEGKQLRHRMVALPWPDVPNDFEIGQTVIDTQSALGCNLYAKDRVDKGFDGGSISLDSLNRCLSALELNSPYGGSLPGVRIPFSHASQDSRSFTKPRNFDNRSSAKGELTLLSDLLGVKSNCKDDPESKPMKLNLFPSSGFESNGDWEDDDYNESSTIIIDIDGGRDTKTVQRYLDDLDFNDAKAESKGSIEEDDDDLLALMDSASK